MKIVIDTREQAPYSFSGYDALVQRATLDTGDYSIKGFETVVAVERKAPDDLMACLTRERERFTRELDRLRGFHSAAIVVEMPFDYLGGGMYRSSMKPESAVQSVISIIEKYRMPIFFATTRKMGEFFTYHFLRHFARHTAEQLKAAMDAMGEDKH